MPVHWLCWVYHVCEANVLRLDLAFWIQNKEEKKKRVVLRNDIMMMKIENKKNKNEKNWYKHRELERELMCGWYHKKKTTNYDYYLYGLLEMYHMLPVFCVSTLMLCDWCKSCVWLYWVGSI